MIKITDKARQKIKEIVPSGSFLRIKLEGAGCAGFQYVFEIVTQQGVDLCGGLESGVLVESNSVKYLTGSLLDYKESLMSSGFEITFNPNAENSCGCGTSFTPKTCS